MTIKKQVTPPQNWQAEQEDEGDDTEYFWLSMFIFRCVALTPTAFKRPWLNTLHRCYCWFVVVAQILHVISMAMFFILYTVDFKEVMAMLSMCSHALMRLTYMWWKQNDIQKILYLINKEGPKKSIAPYGMSKPLTPWVRRGLLFVAIYMCGNQLTCVQWFSVPAVLNLQTSHTRTRPRYGNVTWNPEPLSMPSVAWFPFDYTVSPVFELVYIFQCFNIYTAGVIIACLDSFVMHLTLLLYGQFDLLKHSFQNVIIMSRKEKAGLLQQVDEAEIDKESPLLHHGTVYENNNLYPAKRMDRDDNEALRLCIVQHQILLEVLSRWERFWSIIMVPAFLNIILVLVFAVFEAVTISTAALIKAINLFELFFMGSWELFVFSWSGGILLQQQISVAAAIYSTPWYECSEGFKRSLRIIVARSYTPIVLTIGKMTRLRIETFTEEMSRVFSLFMVLYQMRN